MIKINDVLITESENYLTGLLSEKLPSGILFHDFNHAMSVKGYAETIGGHEGLDPEEMNILRICALFRDTGYVNYSGNYIEESIHIASEFLQAHHVNSQAIEHICEIIRSTEPPHSPKGKIAEVLSDAAMMYITSENALELFDLLYDEMSMLDPGQVKRQTFEKKYIEYYTTHTYFTEYGKKVLQPKKEAVVRRISERLKRRKQSENKKEQPTPQKLAYSRGVDTMFRITARNQINLNSIADNKSNILISVNAIIISIIITMLAGNLGNLSHDIVPIIVFLVVCLITIIIAILSTRPNIVTRKFTGEDIRNKKVDLIFFGNFIKLSYDDYENAVKEMMKDESHLYSTLLKNQYELGKILAKKFHLVKMAYNVFMFGIIITVITFLVNYLIVHSPAA